MGNSSALNGSFFLGIGSVEGEQTISYIQKNEDGSSQLLDIKSKDAYIYEDSKDAYIRKVTKVGKEWWFSPFEFRVNSKTEFHVPEGTILESFEIGTKSEPAK